MKQLVTLETLQEFNENKTKNIKITTDGVTTISGGLKVEGVTSTVDQQTLAIKDNIIITNNDGESLAGEAGFVVKTGVDSEGNADTSTAYGITYNPAKEVNGVRLGLGNVSEDGKFTFEEDQAQFVATRSDEIPEGSLVSWDDAAKTLVEANLQHGTGVGGLQQVADGVEDGFSFTGKNPNATSFDDSLTGTIPYGATGAFSSAFGGKSAAQGKRSHAEGTTTIAKGKYSHAEGDNSVTLGDDSHAEGNTTVAVGNGAHSEGRLTIAEGDFAHAEGLETHAKGYSTHAEGVNATAVGEGSHAEGYGTVANGKFSHAEGTYSKTEAEGAHAEGNSTASGSFSHSEGLNTTASGEYSHTEGYNTTASGKYSHAGGCSTIASGDYSYAEGNTTRALGGHSHTAGYNTTAEGDCAYAEGNTTSASGNHSHASGYQTKAIAAEQFVVGRWNNPDTNNLFEVGNGTAEDSRTNAMEVSFDGTVKAQKAFKLEKDNSFTSDAFTKDSAYLSVDSLTFRDVTAGSAIAGSEITYGRDSIAYKSWTPVADGNTENTYLFPRESGRLTTEEQLKNKIADSIKNSVISWNSPELLNIDLSGRTIQFNTAYNLTLYGYALFESTGGYSLIFEGPPSLYLSNKRTGQVQQFTYYTWPHEVQEDPTLEEGLHYYTNTFTLPDDFGRLCNFGIPGYAGSTSTSPQKYNEALTALKLFIPAGFTLNLSEDIVFKSDNSQITITTDGRLQTTTLATEATDVVTLATLQKNYVETSAFNQKASEILEAYQQIVEELSGLAAIAKTGNILDLISDEDTEIIFDGGSADTTLAILDNTVLE